MAFFVAPALADTVGKSRVDIDWIGRGTPESGHYRRA
jgi:hypothetical protein